MKFNTTAKMFKFKENQNSHMPFIAIAPKGEIKQFCCIMVNGLWKLHHYENGEWKRINTHLPEDATECSPTAEWINNQWKISFVAGGHSKDRTYYLYQMKGINSEPIKIVQAGTGFIFKNIVVYAGANPIINVKTKLNLQKIELLNAKIIYRLNYNPWRPSEILISGRLKDNKLFSYIYDLSKKELIEILADNDVAYKMAKYRDKVFYAKRLSENFEDRKIVQASDIAITALDYNLHIKTSLTNQMPSTGQMMSNFTNSMTSWAKNGFALADDETLEQRKSICQKCEFFTGSRCQKCGCFTQAKLRLKTESCPLNKW